MSSSDLDRVAADVSTIRQAMRLDKPYTRDDVKLDLVTSLTGVLALLLVTYSPLEAKPAFLLSLLPGAAYFIRFTAQQRRRRATHPSPWKEEKLTFHALFIAMPLVLGWLAWSRLVGNVDVNSAGAAAVYFVGVALGVLGVLDPNRRRYLAGSAVLLAFGLALPSLTPHQVILGGAWALVAGGLLSAAITAIQLRGETIPTAGDAA